MATLNELAIILSNIYQCLKVHVATVLAQEKHKLSLKK